MKKLIQFSLLLMLMPLLAPTCRSEEFDQPSKGLTIDFDIFATAATATANAQPTKSEEVFEKTYSVSIPDELTKRNIKIDLSKLVSLKVKAVEAKFNQQNCLKLEYYTLIATFPGLAPQTSNTDCNAATLIKIDAANNTTQFAKDVLAADFAPAIRKGDPITIYFKMKVKKGQEIEAGFGTSVSLSTRITYLP
jgi:hypothetical protein